MGAERYSEFQTTSKNFSSNKINPHQYHTFFISTLLSSLSSPLSNQSSPSLNINKNNNNNNLNNNLNNNFNHTVEDVAKACDILCELISLLPDKSKRDELIHSHLLWKQKVRILFYLFIILLFF